MNTRMFIAVLNIGGIGAYLWMKYTITPTMRMITMAVTSVAMVMASNMVFSFNRGKCQTKIFNF